MIYESITGWFGYEDVYREMVERHSSGVFVELGTFLGRSAAFMAETIKNSGKSIKFYTVDTHEFYRSMSDREKELNSIHVDCDWSIADVRRNLAPLEGYVEIVQGNSWDGIPGVASCDFCWIDASHAYEDVKRDLAYWLPRSKVIGGDDFGFGGVRDAVVEMCKGYTLRSGGWMLDPNPYYE